MTSLSEHLSGARALGSLAGVIEAIAQAGRLIGAKIRRARIEEILGEAGTINVQGEVQQKLDIVSDEIVLSCLKSCPGAGVYASEEQERASVIRSRADGGEYCILSDPLDGSSNIDVAAGVGTIFSVLPNASDGEGSVLQPGSEQVAAGYILFGSSILMVLATAAGVDMYVLDPKTDEYVLVKEGVTLPAEKKIYSLNEAYWDDFDDGLKQYLGFAHANGYSLRYIGSMVADVHRTLLKGGVFIYPATAKAPAGKLRLMYEANPMAMVMEKAGGLSTTGTTRTLDVQPTALHQRTPVILGSKGEVERVLEHLAKGLRRFA